MFVGLQNNMSKTRVSKSDMRRVVMRTRNFGTKSLPADKEMELTV